MTYKIGWGKDAYTTVQALELEGYKFEFEYGEYGYEWQITKIFTKDRRVFSLTSGGCSCNYFDDTFIDSNDAIGDLREVTSVPHINDIIDVDGDPFGVQEKFRQLGLL